MSKIVKTWDEHQGELLYIKGKIAFIKESNGEVWFCLKTDIIDFDEINMEEYYVKDVGKITYVYGVNLEEHKTVVEKQQKHIAELEQELAELKEKAIVPRFRIGQEIYVIYNGQINIGRIYEIQTNSVLHDKEILIIYLVDFYSKYEDDEQDNDYFEEKDIFITEQEAQDKLKEIQGNE